MATFLLLFGYISLCGLLTLLYLSGALHYLGVITRLEQVHYSYSPCWLRNLSVAQLPKFVYSLCSLLYHAVVLGSHILAITEVVPLADQELSSSAFNHPAVMYHVWFIHTLIYLLCTSTGPGVLTKHNYKTALRVYKYDGNWYKSENKCQTCDIVKPARSKHCSVCGVCVFRFDHHCLWINCCVGARNYRYFVAFLVTTLVMTVNGSLMCYSALSYIYSVKQLGHMKYMHYDGTPRSLQGVMLLQYMFYEYPRIFLLGCSLLLLTVILALFISYHFYLILFNKTTNESYKRSSTSQQVYDGRRSFYDRGFVRNVREILFPAEINKHS